MTRLEHVIARNVAELREEREATQADLAAKMRHNGFTWTTNRVTQLETLRRPVSLLEVVGLSHVFLVPVERLLAGDDLIDMPDGSTMALSLVRDALAGRGHIEIRDMTPEESDRYEGARDDMRKVAAGLGMEVDELASLAYTLWGHSFWSERDQRVGDLSGLTKRSAQTKRGHATRKIIAEIKATKGHKAVKQEKGAERRG